MSTICLNLLLANIMFPCAEVVYKCESFASLGVGFGVFVTKKCPG